MFSCFGDMRGIQAQNPVCRCPSKHYSRAVVDGEWEEGEKERAIHYRCAVGGCSFIQNGGTLRLGTKRLRVEDVVKAGLQRELGIFGRRDDDAGAHAVVSRQCRSKFTESSVQFYCDQ